MKRLIFILMIMLFGLSTGYAQSVEYTNQVTIAYDEVLPIEITDIISYQVWIDSSMTGIVMIGETDLLQYTITFTQEGEYIIGVNTKRVVASTGDIVYSDMNWSNEDIPVGATLIPFVVRYIKPIQSPENLRLP